MSKRIKVKPKSKYLRIDKKWVDWIWTMDEKILIKKLQRKDERALEKIIDIYSAYITYIVWELLRKKGTREDVEEVVADTFISLWMTAERVDYKHYSSIRAYIGTIARNKAKDWLRTHRGVDLVLDEDIVSVDQNLELLVLQKEQQKIVQNTLKELKPEDREIFTKYYYECMKIEEIAEELQMNPQTIKTRLRRGRETLKQILLKEGYRSSEIEN